MAPRARLRAVFARLTADQARALYEAVGQWVDNESTRDDGEEDPKAAVLRPVVDALDAAWCADAGVLP